MDYIFYSKILWVMKILFIILNKLDVDVLYIYIWNRLGEQK
jgi:hypothetical protein